MNNTEIITEQMLGDIILCDPVTRRGVEALEEIGLTVKRITPDYFYRHIWVSSKYNIKAVYEKEPEKAFNEEKYMYYQYTADQIQFKTIQNQYNEFNKRFASSAINQHPLLILGVAGNGKSIEINRRIRNLNSDVTNKECDGLYFDLESAPTRLTYGYSYICPEKNSTLWLFCIKILKGIMEFIRNNSSLCHAIYNNFKKDIASNNIITSEQHKVFKNINNYSLDDNHTETNLFQSITDLLDSNNPENDIEMLLEILMIILYCSAPQKKHYIVFDNIEQYIKVNLSKIQILNSEISRIYQIINDVVTNVTNDFDRIKPNLGWKSFKTVIVLRRTSLGLFEPTLLHTPVREFSNMTDLTGHFPVSKIWENKKKYIWDGILKKQLSNEDNDRIIEIMEDIMNDGTRKIGMNYQSLIAPLMSYGIRRNARAQAHAAFQVFNILNNHNPMNLDYGRFCDIMDNASRFNNTVRYMFRRALIEIQFKWSMAEGNRDRWKKLNIGHLSGMKDKTYLDRHFMIEEVAYHHKGYVTLLRRVLAFLSKYPEKPIRNSNGKTVVEMFSTISLYDVIKNVLINPAKNNQILKEDYLQLAQVLIALGNMSHQDTLSAPYIILSIKEKVFHSDAYESTLAELLEKIYLSGQEKSLPDNEYKCSEYGIRITDAGYSFMLDWHASFSFFASLHCFTIPPLFFIKDAGIIKYVISTVYYSAANLCDMYEEEAASFCGSDITLKTGKCLPEYNSQCITFRKRVKDLHINHLSLYKNYLIQNYKAIGLSDFDMIQLAKKDSCFINEFISKYNEWKTEEGALECF